MLIGLNLVVFWVEDGKVYVVDIYCLYMGVNFVVGGWVVGDCIECLFYGW